MDLDLSAASDVRALLARHGLRPEHRLGQNFLVDRRALADIVAAAEVGPDDTVLEVGAGLGVLTRALAERARRVVALEIDGRLLPALRESLAGHDHVEVRRQDAMRFDHGELPEGSLLVANLPYQIGTALLANALASRRYRRLVALVQKEVAERITASPGDEGYGAFSLLCRHWAKARTVRHVAPGAFLPPPKVTSSVIRLDPRPEAREDEPLFALIRDAFRHRRKTLQRNLAMAGYEPRQVAERLEALGLDPRVRAEALDLDAFRALLAGLRPQRAHRGGERGANGGR